MATFPFSNILDGTKKLWSVVTGAEADHAAATLNPVKVAGKYTVTDPAYHDGDITTLRTNVKGEQIVQLSGSKMELYGAAIGNRPAANTVSAGTTFTIVDDTLEFDSYVSDGTDWMEV